MPVIVNRLSRVMIQGITGAVGKQYAERMHLGCTNLVAGVTPGKGDTEVFGTPVYNTVREAIRAQNPDVSLIVVPPNQVCDAVFEAVEQGLKTVVVYTDEVPVHDALKLVSYAAKNNAILLGPGAAGIAVPRQCNIGEMSDVQLLPGRFGVLTKSGSLCGEVLRFMKNCGIGQSTVCAVGGGMITGLRLKDVLAMFLKDPETSHVVMLGEVGGNDEIETADLIAGTDKPVMAYIAGHYAPPGVRMGHAGAIMGDIHDGANYKSEVLRRAGAKTASTIQELFAFIEASAN